MRPPMLDRLRGKIRRARFAYAFAAGAAHAAGFAPLGWWPLSLFSLGVLFALWLRAQPAAAAGLGFAFGLGMFGVGTSWVYVSLHTFGGMPAPLAAVCVAVMTAAIALIPAAAGFLQAFISVKLSAKFAGGPTRAAAGGWRLGLLMPGVWVPLEWLRGWLLGGFPWLSLGYAMLDTPLAGFAPWGGVYLVGLLAAATVGAAAAVMHMRSPGNFIFTSVLAAGWLSGGAGWTDFAWTRPQGAPIRVAIVQNNVPLADKWTPAARDRIIADYLAQSAPYGNVDLVAWPEAAVGDYLDALDTDFYNQIAMHPADFVFGVLTRAENNGVRREFNSIAALRSPPSGARLEVYHKQHLVPFGEFVPQRKLFQPLLNYLHIPMADFARGPAPQSPLRAAGVNFAASICYEDAFPRLMRSQVPAAGALLNVSEDAWFGDSLAPHQRLQMARFRALESGRALVRASNNGLSAVINARGDLTAVAGQFVKTVLVAELQPRAGVTPYTAYGDRAALWLAAVMTLLGGVLIRRARR